VDHVGKGCLTFKEIRQPGHFLRLRPRPHQHLALTGIRVKIDDDRPAVPCQAACKRNEGRRRRIAFAQPRRDNVDTLRRLSAGGDLLGRVIAAVPRALLRVLFGNLGVALPGAAKALEPRQSRARFRGLRLRLVGGAQRCNGTFAGRPFREHFARDDTADR